MLKKCFAGLGLLSLCLLLAGCSGSTDKDSTAPDPSTTKAVTPPANGNAKTEGGAAGSETLPPPPGFKAGGVK